jgi:hypothetical protein
MGLFIYDTANHAALTEVLNLVRRTCRTLVPLGLNPNDFMHAVRTLTRHDVVVVPTDVEQLTPMVQRLQQIAHVCGIRVVPLAAYMASNARAQIRLQQTPRNTTPVAASAAPPTQHHAAAGKPLTPLNA